MFNADVQRGSRLLRPAVGTSVARGSFGKGKWPVARPAAAV
jgi:hypothetical protein